MVKIFDWNDYPNFEEHEFACHCGCGRADMSHVFMTKLQILRETVGFGIVINSGYRCDAYDIEIGGAGVHPSGYGGDIRVFGAKSWSLLGEAYKIGFPRIGISQKGPRIDRFIHLDMLISPGHPSPWIWTY